MIREQQEEANQYQIQAKMMQKLRELNDKYEIKESWVLQFVNQYVYLSNLEIIDFVDSCEELTLQVGEKFLPRINNKHDYIYCLISGRAKIMRASSHENNWELKRLKLVSLYNYKVYTSDDAFSIIADSTAQFLRFSLPFTRQEHCTLNSRRSFLCSFFDVDFTRVNFNVLDLFKPAKYIVGEKLTKSKEKLCIVKEGVCNYSYWAEGELANSKIVLLDRSGPFILNYESFIDANANPEQKHQITVKQAQIVCLEAPVGKLAIKGLYHIELVKQLREKCELESQWVDNLIKEKVSEVEHTQKIIKRKMEDSKDGSLLSQLNYADLKRKLFDNDKQQLNLLTKTIYKTRLLNKEKRVSFQLEMDMRTLTPTPNPNPIQLVSSTALQISPQKRQSRTLSRISQSSAMRKQSNPQIILDPNFLLSKKIDLKALNDYETAVNNKKKVLNNKLKQEKKQLFLYAQSPNTSTKSFKLRMIQTGYKMTNDQSIKHTDSSKKVDKIKNKYIQKIERSNRIGMQCMIIRSESHESLQPLQSQLLDSKRYSVSTRRLSNAEYHNYLVHGDVDNPKQEPLQRVHRKVKILSNGTATTYNHSEHLKKKARLFRYSSNRARSQLRFC